MWGSQAGNVSWCGLDIKGLTGIRNHTEPFCFLPPNPSGWGTWSCPIWLKPHPLASLPKQAGPRHFTRWQDAICAQKCAASRLGRVTIATARRGISGSCADTDWSSPPSWRREGVCYTDSWLPGAAEETGRGWGQPLTCVSREWVVTLSIHSMNGVPFFLEVWLFLGRIVWCFVLFNHEGIPPAICNPDTSQQHRSDKRS